MMENKNVVYTIDKSNHKANDYIIENKHVQQRTGWKILFAIMFVYLFYYTGRQNFGWALNSINQELGLSMNELGWISFAMLLTYGIGQFINGNLGDKFGGRAMVTIGGLFSCVFNWFTSFGFSFWTILVPWAANGYVQSMGWAPASRMISNWFPPKQRGKAFGWYVFSAGSSSILIFVLGAAIAALHLSWQWVFRLPVILLSIACIVFYMVARNKPEDIGLPPIEEDSNNESSDAVVTEEKSIQRYIGVLKNRRFLLATFSIGFESLSRYGLIIWLPVHLMGPAYKENAFGVWIGVALPVGMALGALSSGYISDRLFGSNRSRPISIYLFFAMIIMLAIYFLPPDEIMIGMILLFLGGFLVYGPQSCYWALCPDLLGKKRSATAVGVMNFWAYLIAALSGPFLGWVIDTYNTTTVFLFLGISCALGALVIIPVRR